MTVETRCFTNLDDFHGVDWPRRMVSLPRVGDYVEGRRGSPGSAGSRPRLRVVAVTHASDDPTGSAYVYVELHR